jgi:hypothetical protein
MKVWARMKRKELARRRKMEWGSVKGKAEGFGVWFASKRLL